MNNSANHWTENQDLVGEFVLGRVGSAERVPLERHLKECEECRSRVQKEQILVRQIKAFGRSAMKDRLRIQLEKKAIQALPWPHVFSAAAMLVLLIGWGVSARWWNEPVTVRSEKELLSGRESPLQFEADESGAIEGEARRDAPAAPARAEKKSPTVGSRKSKEEKSQPSSETAFDQVDLQAGALSKTGVVPSAVSSGAGRGYWVEGVITVRQRMEESFRSKAADKEIQGKNMTAAPQTSLILNNKGVIQNYIVQQRPFSSLPLEQRAKQNAAGIMTLVEPNAQGALLTLFTDELSLDDKKVNGEVAGEDSLIVAVDGVKIALKLRPQIRGR